MIVKKKATVPKSRSKESKNGLCLKKGHPGVEEKIYHFSRTLDTEQSSYF